MRRRFLQLEGFVRATPPAALAALTAALDEAGGCILNAQAFSNAALSLTFELTSARLARLQDSLAHAGVVLYDGPAQALRDACANPSDPDAELTGQLLVTLVHDQPDAPGVVPAVPG